MSRAGKRGFYGNRKVGGRSLLGTERGKKYEKKKKGGSQEKGPVGGWEQEKVRN